MLDRIRGVILRVVVLLPASATILAPTVGQAQTAQPLSANLSTIHRNPSLLGKTIRVHTCFSMPMSDVPGDPANNYIALYPCGAKLDVNALKAVAAFATPAAGATISRPPTAAAVDINAFQSDFTGTLTRRKLDPSDAEEVYVIVFKSLTHIQMGKVPAFH